MQSFTLLRTNPKLTTNVKVMYSDNILYLESIDSNPELNRTNYKKFVIPEGTNYPNILARYWFNTPTEIAFDNMDDNDFDIAYDDYKYQLDDIYFSGASRINNSDYKEEFEYFAPIHIYKKDIPSDFIIFRVDGPGILNLTSANFRESILDNMKIVSRYNLRNNSKIGKFMSNTFNMEDFPRNSIDLDFNNSEFTYWNGIDYRTGEFISKGVMMEDIFKNEMSFTQGFETLTNNFEGNGIIYPYIMNLSFLFDDVPASENNLKPWSINRYYGFYGNIKNVGKLSPYQPPSLKKGLKLNKENIFTFNGVEVDPFMRGYKKDRTYYVEYNSDFYLVSKIGDNEFKVISDIELPKDVDNNFNINVVKFGLNNIVKYLDDSDFVLNDDSDILMIEIDGKFHRFSKNNEGKWRILSDYRFTINNNIFKYYINKSDPSYTTTLNLNVVTMNNPPKIFKIYKFNFRDVKDFDTTVIDTDFSRFEFEFESEITRSEEPKLYEDDSNFSGFNKPMEKYIYNKEVVSIPVAGEYLATNELFELLEKESRPNKMWKKNFENIKWGVVGSLSNNDYPYMFNINQHADDYNRTTNVDELAPHRAARNLDYFYTLSNSSYNFGYNTDITYQSLSIINETPFEIDKYFNNNYSNNYFDEIFSQSETYKGVLSNRTKSSKFLEGDQDIPNKTLFKGLDISIYDIDKIEISSNIITNMNVMNSNSFENYDFSIILSELNKNPDMNFDNMVTDSEWKIVKDWERNVTYFPGDVVLFDGTEYKNANGQYGFPGYSTASMVGTVSEIPLEYVYPNGEIEPLIFNTNTIITEKSPTGPNNGIVEMFYCTATTSVSSPSLTIMDDSNWIEYPTAGYNSIFYQKNRKYEAWDSTLSYNHLLAKSGLNSNYMSYFTWYKGQYYISVTEQSSGNNITPEHLSVSVVDGRTFQYWIRAIQYNLTTNYTENTIVTLDGNLYYYDILSEELLLIHSFDPNVDDIYNKYSIIRFNDNYYTNLNDNAIINNGINIYINKKWKNILIHIYINDMFETYNINREVLYKPETQQLVASNIIEIINSITLKNGFINNLNYYIIEKDNSFKKYSVNNISDLPYILQIQRPTTVELYSHSLRFNGIKLNNEIFDIRKRLNNNNIENINRLNYYNGKPLAYTSKRLTNFTFEDDTKFINRFGGSYAPIFNSLQLFDNINGTHYNFNEELKGFGEIRELVKSKVNEKTPILKEKDDAYLSIYAQIDEIGYFIDKHNIFKSTWDNTYYKRTNI